MKIQTLSVMISHQYKKVKVSLITVRVSNLLCEGKVITVPKLILKSHDLKIELYFYPG